MTIVRFPAHRTKPARYVPAGAEPASIIILPIVRVERYPDEPSPRPDEPRRRRCRSSVSERLKLLDKMIKAMR